MPKAPAQSTLKITLRVPEDIHDAYWERATKKGKDVEREIVDHLSATSRYTASQPIYLDDTARGVLSQLAGRPITSAADLLTWARSITSLKVAGTEVPLDSRLLARIETRRFGKPMDQHLRQCVVEQLEVLVGMR